MTESFLIAIILVLCVSSCGKPDLIDGLFYKMTGDKTWECEVKSND